MTLYFACGVLFFVAILKVLGRNLRVSSPGRGQLVYFLSPLISTESWNRALPATPERAKALAFRALGWGLVWWAWVQAYWWVVDRFEPRTVTLSYLGAPVVLWVGETLGTVAQLAYLPSGYVLPPHHRQPLAASSLAEFWGSRWNTWVSDWFRQIVFIPLRRNPALALLITFALSGLIHEIVINVPWSVISDEPRLGSMMVYFMTQAAGIGFERAFLRRQIFARRALTWLLVLGPAPLILNEAGLRVLGLWPYA